ncbi:MAG: hypothetical protein QM674_23525 [Burkholderiaceae bacterium]
MGLDLFAPDALLKGSFEQELGEIRTSAAACASLGSFGCHRVSVSGPLNAGGFGPNEMDRIFGGEVVYDGSASVDPIGAPRQVTVASLAWSLQRCRLAVGEFDRR